MKIDVITLQAVNNYGSVLQAFATQEFLRRHGCSVRIVNCARVNYLSENTKILPALRAKLRESILTFPFLVVPTILAQLWKRKTFDSFRRKNLNITEGKLYRTMKDFENYESDADAFCTGSDQVWNSFWNGGILPQFYLAFIPEGRYKFAFSASFGKTEISAEEVRDTQSYIEGYKHISVREDSAVKILKEQYHYDRAVHIQDPTLCIDPETWRQYAKYAKGRESTEKYILIYNAYDFEGEEDERRFYDYAKKLSEKTGLRLVQVCLNFGQFCKSFLRKTKAIVLPDVFRFISLIDNARYVLTDSFHGTAFSLNLNTEPICIYPQRFTTRIESLLKLTNTLHRHVKGCDDFGVLDRPVHFDEVNQILNSERKKASDWLKMVLADIQEHSA